MATTPKKNGFAGKKKRSPVALAATVVLIAALCGAIVAAFLFTNTTSQSTVVKVKAGTDEHYEAAAAKMAAASCQQQKCKAGGSEVCGTDGKTYLNECFFQNAQCKDPSIQKVKDWKGYNCPNTCKKQIACKEVGKFLCATDGNVYFGYCNLYVAQCLDPTIKEVECDSSIFEGAFGH